MPVSPDEPTQQGLVLRGLPPIARADARVLILGSMPGAASLQAGQYYAHGQNRFWRYMDALVGAGTSLPYPQRVQRLCDARIAVWDVIATCRREGSLDSAIRDEAANDFDRFLRLHPDIATVLFNGAKAQSSFNRQARPVPMRAGLNLLRLPSTSPANASQPDAVKLAAWRAALIYAGARVIGATLAER